MSNENHTDCGCPHGVQCSPVLPLPAKPSTVADYLEALGTVEVESTEGGRYQVRGTKRGLLMRWWRTERNEWAPFWSEAGEGLLALPIVAPAAECDPLCDPINRDPCITCTPLPPALAPQPPPANPPRGEPVWPLVIAEAAGNEAPPELITLMRARDQQGRAKYGVPLSANDGRDTTMDALQEALDLIVYLRKRRAEGREGSEWWEYEVVQVARSLLAEMEEMEMERAERGAAPVSASPGSSGEAGKQCETCGHTEGQEAPPSSSAWYRGKPIDISCPTCGWMGEVAR